MKKILIGCLILVVLIFLGLFSLGFIVALLEGANKTPAADQTTKASAPADDNSPWHNYQETDHGYSLKIPKLIGLSTIPCLEPESGKQVSVYEVPTTVIKEGLTTYVAASYSLNTDAQGTELGTCRRSQTNLASIKDFFAGKENTSYIGWKLTVIPVENKGELEAYVKTLFEQTCKIDTMTWNEQGQYTEMKLTGLDPNDSEQCFIDYEVHFKYSEAKKKLVMMEGAQDCIFPDPAQNANCLDEHMVASFRFE